MGKNDTLLESSCKTLSNEWLHDLFCLKNEPWNILTSCKKLQSTRLCKFTFEPIVNFDLVLYLYLGIHIMHNAWTKQLREK